MQGLGLSVYSCRSSDLCECEPARRGQRGPAYAYHLSRTRQDERRRVEQAETVDLDAVFALSFERPPVVSPWAGALLSDPELTRTAATCRILSSKAIGAS